MLNLFEMLARAQGGAAMDAFARQFKLTPQQTEAAVEALLPAFMLGLQQMASSPEGLYKLGNLMAQSTYKTLLQNPAASASAETAGNEALRTLFGSPEMTRAIAEQAAQFAGLGLPIMQKMLPLMAAMVMGGLSQWMPTGQPASKGLGEPESGAPAATPPERAKDQPGTEAGVKTPPPADAHAIFGSMFEAGRSIQQAHLDNMQRLFAAFLPKSDKR